MKTKPSLSSLAALLGCGVTLMAADPVFSGPQVGEKTTPFKVVEVRGANAAKERDPIAENAGQPTALLFVHGLERSLVPLLRVVDEYGVEQKDRLKTEIVFLSADRLQGEQRVKAASTSLKLQSQVGLSVDGIEGPGNYGLNKECLMTILVTKDNTVTANFALVQPGIADAPKVLAALAEVCGDADPPTAEQLNARRADRDGQPPRGGEMRRGGAPDKPQEGFPGAVPTDERLQGLLRSFIRPTNEDARVDQVLREVKEHIQGHPDLRSQAVDGWTRVLHFGDRYGTEYARKVGRQFLEELKQEPK